MALAAGCALAATAALAPVATAAPTTALVRGTVTGADGSPLRNVSVAAVIDTGVFGTQTVVGPVTTAADGSYRLRGDFSGGDTPRLQFTAVAATGGTSATGYADTCWQGKPWCSAGGTDLHLPAGTTSRADVTLERAAVLTGRAVDALGRGVGGFAVSLWTGAPDQAGDAFVRPLRVTTTDVNGNYTFGQLLTWSFGRCYGNGDGSFGSPIVEPATPARDGYLGRRTVGAPVRTAQVRRATSRWAPTGTGRSISRSP